MTALARLPQPSRSLTTPADPIPEASGATPSIGDRRFHDQMAGKVPLDGGFNWCIYQRKN
ncbi:Hypothetical protein A7982_03022 [Minicystis rosea]|nr:Hypothetical protein A7982_03022 [Minicystis rosea]